MFSQIKEKVARLCDGPGDTFPFAPLHPSLLRVRAVLGEWERAELSSLQRERCSSITLTMMV